MELLNDFGVEMKDVKGYEGRYMVTRDGRVYSTYKKGFLRFKTDKDGYKAVCLQKDGTKKYYLVHRLVAETYLENPFNLPTVNHKDGNKANNNVDNLEWCTFSDNLKHAYRMNLRSNKGSKSPTSKLNEDDVRLIKRLLRMGLDPREIAKQYNVVPGTIYNIKSLRSWSHIDEVG